MWPWSTLATSSLLVITLSSPPCPLVHSLATTPGLEEEGCSQESSMPSESLEFSVQN